MDDNYFDKKLKDILKSPPDFKPDEAAINDMKARLQQLPASAKGFNWSSLLLSLLFLLFFLGGIYFYQKNQQLQKQLLLLSENTSQTQIDTVFKQQIIYQIDTIYNTIYHTEYVNTSSFDYQPRSSNPNHLFSFSNISLGNDREKDFRWNLNTYGFPLFATPSDSSFSTTALMNERTQNSEQQGVTIINDWKNEAITAIKHPNWITLQRPSVSPLFHRTALNNHRLAKVSPLYYFQSIGTSVQVQASPLVIPMNDFGGSAFSFGATLSLDFPQNRSMNIGVEYLQNKFELKEPNTFESFPIANPENPNDNLYELKATLTYLQVPITFQQTFLQREKWESSVNVGLVAYRPLRQKFLYEYLNNTGEYKLPLELTNGAFSVDNLRLSWNNLFRFNTKIYLNTAIQYQHGFSLNADEYFPLRYWSMNLGLKYQFEE